MRVSEPAINRFVLALAVSAIALPASAQYGGVEGFIQEFDLNRDGQTPVAEFIAARNIRYDLTDLNRDGVINQAEYVEEYRVRLERQLAATKLSAAEQESTRKSQIDQAPLRFQFLDVDKDGKLSRDEFHASGHRMFDEHDRNRDGTITKADDVPKGAPTA